MKTISIKKWEKIATQEELTLFSKTLQHKFFSPFIEFVELDSLLKMSNPHYANETDNGIWDNSQTLTLDKLFEDIKEKGMRDPFFVSLGIETTMMRLETGNQRVQIFKIKNIKYVPVIGYLTKNQIVHEGNGIHQGIPCVLKNLPNFDFMGPYQIFQFVTLSKFIKQS